MGIPDIPTRKARLQKILTTIEASSYNFDLANQTTRSAAWTFTSAQKEGYAT